MPNDTTSRPKFSRRSAAWGAFMGPYFAIMFAVLAMGTIAPPADAQGPSPVSSNPLCRFVTGCMSRAMCDKAGGQLTACPNLGGNCRESGWGLCYPPQTAIAIKIPIMGQTAVLDIGEYISLAYKWAVGAAAVVAATMFMIGGFQYLTAGGNTSRVSQGQQRIKDAMIGLGLTIFAWLILNTINPALVALRSPRVPLVPPQRFVQCELFKMQAQCGAPFALKEREGVTPSTPPEQAYAIVSPNDPAAIATCVGRSCSLAGSWDATHACRQTGSGSPPETIPENAPVPPFSCEPCARFGAECTGLGPSSECCSGYCSGAESQTIQAGGRLASYAGVTGNCSSGNTGVACAIDAECFGGHCADIEGSNTGGFCTAGIVGALCDNDDECNTGLVCVDDIPHDDDGRCLPPMLLGICLGSSDCPSGIPCRHHENGGDEVVEDDDGGVCGNLSDFIFCDTDADCAGTGVCWTEDWFVLTAEAESRGKRGLCKQPIAGSLCVKGGNMDDTRECNPAGSTDNYCCDGCFEDNEADDTSNAGLCVKPAGGAGCDDDSQCRRSPDPNMARALCSQLPSGQTGGACTYPGTAGNPCINKNDGAGPHSCMPPLTCPTRGEDGAIFRCVMPRP